MVIEQQISARRERAHGSIVRILTRPDGNLYGDYSVRSASNKTYRVAMRGPGLFDNYCSCPDFAVNTLGTCKHIEALLARLRRRRGKAFDREVFRFGLLLASQVPQYFRNAVPVGWCRSALGSGVARP